MSFFQWLTPTGAIKGTLQGLKKAGSWFKDQLSNVDWSGFKDGVSKLWKDYTGQTAIEQQNAANMEMAKYQAQMQEDFYNKYSSPEALMRQYQAAGLNPNLVYGSASSGQGNVPGFNAPNIERSMSGSQKIDRALSALSQGLGLVQGVYQAAAAREAAQQSAVKTANDVVSYKRNAMDYYLDANARQFFVGSPFLGYFGRKRSVDPNIGIVGDTYSRYLDAYRAGKMNEWMFHGLRNAYDYGMLFDREGSVLQLPELQPYMKSRNLTQQLRYTLMNDLGNTGTYGKLLISALQLLK